MCKQLRKRDMDLCCLWQARWKGQEAQFVGCRGRRYKLRWSENNHGTGGVGILVKKELCEKVVEVRKKSEKVMAMVLVFEEEVIRVIYAYAPQVGRSECKKDHFYNDMASV